MRQLLAVLLMAVVAPVAWAEIRPNPLVSTGMVLQRGVECPIWGQAMPGEKISWKLTQPQNKELTGDATADDKGDWLAKLPVIEKAGGPFTLTLKGDKSKKTAEVVIKDVLVGEVWLASGQSNMQWVMSQIQAPDDIKNSANPKVRMFSVQLTAALSPQKEVVGRWLPAHPFTTGTFSAVGYYFARALSAKLGVPVGIISSSYGGTVAEAWTSKKTLSSISSLKYLSERHDTSRKNYEVAFDKYLTALEDFLPKAKKARAAGEDLPALPLPPSFSDPNIPTVLYNAMLRPLQPYAIKGVIWYQGESNALGNRSHEYQTLFPAMIKNWREDWKNEDMPFLFVQLAPWRAIAKEPMESDWAELCEAQRLTSLNVKNTAMAVINDVGDPGDIHPRKKKPVGERLALAARAIAYGEKIEYTGPVFDKIEITEGKAILTFKNVGKGLEMKGDKLTGFTIAGKDKKWHNAVAEIKGDNQVVVSSADVKEPVAVRFGWANHPVVNLWNKDGLPASAFRTDDFTLLSQAKK